MERKERKKSFKFSGYAYRSFLESLNTLIYVSSTVFCGKKATSVLFSVQAIKESTIICQNIRSKNLYINRCSRIGTSIYQIQMIEPFFFFLEEKTSLTFDKQWTLPAESFSLEEKKKKKNVFCVPRVFTLLMSTPMSRTFSTSE